MMKVTVKTTGMTHFAHNKWEGGKVQLFCRGNFVLAVLAPTAQPLECKRCWAFGVKNAKTALYALGISNIEYMSRLKRVFNIEGKELYEKMERLPGFDYDFTAATYQAVGPRTSDHLPSL